MLNVRFSDKSATNSQAIVILIGQDLELNNDSMMIDQKYHGLISKTIQNKNIFSGKAGQVKILSTIDKDGEAKNLVIIGIGSKQDLKPSDIEEIGGRIIYNAISVKAPSISVKIASINNIQSSEVAALIASGAVLGSYKFDKYFTKKEEQGTFEVQDFQIEVEDISSAEKLFAFKKSLIEGVFLARDCISEPANILYPESYAEIIINELEPLDVKVEVLGEREMRELGMGALLGVGQGSSNESKLIVMKYTGDKKEVAPSALVGKGVTFDSGGISLKPSAGMADMKYDMAGSAAVVGSIKALALRRAKVNVVGVIGLVENLPGGSAQKPSDVVTTMSGQTAEVLDTDAEGRLVLADAIWYAQDKFNPKCVIDLATLTGAIVVALGNTYAGLFTNNDDLATKLINAGNVVDEKLWRMPLHKDFDEMIKSDIADVANLGNVRGAAGSSTAAHFISRFIKKDMQWAHLDIAGMAWKKKGMPICPKGAAGYGVRLLNQFTQDYYEAK